MSIIAYKMSNGIRFEFNNIPPLQWQHIWATLADIIEESEGGCLKKMCDDLSAETESSISINPENIQKTIGNEVKGIPIFWP